MAKKKPVKRTPAKTKKPSVSRGWWIPAFLRHLSKSANPSAAAKKAGVTRKVVYEWKRDDPEFAEQWEEAHESALDDLEEVAWKRARRDSDSMLKFLLGHHRGYAYKDRVLQEIVIQINLLKQQVEHVQVSSSQRRLFAQGIGSIEENLGSAIRTRIADDGEVENGPSPGDGSGGHAPRPLAAEDIEVEPEEFAPLLFEADRQNPNGRIPGPKNGTP